MASFFKSGRTTKPSFAFAASAKAGFSCAHTCSVNLPDAIIVASVFVFALCIALVVRVQPISLALLAATLAFLLVIIIKPRRLSKDSQTVCYELS